MRSYSSSRGRKDRVTIGRRLFFERFRVEEHCGTRGIHGVEKFAISSAGGRVRGERLQGASVWPIYVYIRRMETLHSRGRSLVVLV